MRDNLDERIPHEAAGERPDIAFPGGVDDNGGIAHQWTVNVNGRDPREGYGLLVATEKTGHFQGDPLLVNDDL